MAKYFDNNPFLESMPGNGNNGDNSGLKIILTVSVVIVVLTVIGFEYRRHTDSKIVQRQKEKDQKPQL